MVKQCVLSVALMWLVAAHPLSAQEAKEKAEGPAERVRLLVRQLDDESRRQRDLAEKELLELGAAALEHLPAMDHAELTAEQRRRLRQLLPRLWQVRLKADVDGRRVQIVGSVPLLDALKQIQEQTGIVVNDIRGQFNQEPTNPSLDLKLEKTPFWQAIDTVGKQAGMSTYFQTDDRSVGLVGRPTPDLPTSYHGAFRFSVQRIILRNDFTNDEEMAGAQCSIQLDAQYEPHLRPVLVEVDTATFNVSDDKGRKLDLTGPETYPLAIESETYQFQFLVRTGAPGRDALRIAKLAGELSVWLPSHVEDFAFESLDSTRPAEKETSGVRLQLNSIGDDEGVWTIPVVVEHLVETRNVDSHLEVALENELWLVHKESGERYQQNGGLSTFEPEPGKTGVEYLFVDMPGKLSDYKLQIRIPAGITRVPVPFSFENLPLP